MPRFPYACLLALGCTPLLAGQLAAQQIRSVLTSSDLSQRLMAQPALAFAAAGDGGGLPVVSVDATKRFQVMEGFGASITDGSAYLLQQVLSPQQRDAAMETLFSPERGMGLSFLRQPIGSEDLSRHHFTFDDMPAGQTDPTLAHFRVPSEQPEIFAIVRQALRLNPKLTVMVTPWSPPAWMKSGDTMNGGELLQQDEEVYARYLTQAVQRFEAEGIPVKYMTVQNEPLNGIPKLASTQMPATQAARFIGNDLGPALRQAGLKTTVLAYDHNWDHPEYPELVLGDAKASPFVAGSALHCYGGQPEAQDGIHVAFPEKGIWMTECSGGTWDREPALIKTARLVIGSTRHWAKAVLLWGVALDQDHGPHDGGCGTCRPLVEVDRSKTPVTVSYTGDLYGLGQLSRFVAPGAVRIDSTSFGHDGVETVAFQAPDGTVVLYALNNAASSARFAIAWRGKTAAVTMPGSTVETFTWAGH